MNRDLKQIAKSLREGPEVQPGVMWFSRELALDLANVCEQADAELAKAEACSTELSQRVAQEQIHSNKTAEDLFAIRRGEAPSEGASALIKEIHVDYVEARSAGKEIARLREFEAREVAVTNFFAAIVMFGEGQISEKQFQGAMRAHETVLCSAIESLGRRDKIRGAEGEIRALERAHAAFQNADLNVDAYFDLEIGRLQRDIAEARAGK